jgi:PAS domain S-box-containing protein
MSNGRSSQRLATSAVRYAVPFLLILTSLLIRLATQRWLGVSVPYLHFFPAVMIAAWFGGLGPGILATLLSAATAAYFFLEPQNFMKLSSADAISIPVFVAIGIGISWLTESVRRSEASQRNAAFKADQRASELEAIFEAMADGVYVGNQERITRVNAAGLRVLGAASLEDLNAGSHERGEKFALRSAATGERLEGERLPFSRALRGEVVVEEVIARRADTGEDVFLRTSAAPILDNHRVVGAVAVNADVTEQRRAAERLEQTTAALSAVSRRLEEVVANVPGVVWEAWGQPDTATQRIDFVSNYVETMLGYAPAEWTSTPNFWLTIVHPDDQERAGQEARAIFTGGVGGRSEFRWVGRDGRVLWVEGHSTVILDERRRPVGMRGVTLDITARKQLELERAALLVRERHARADAVAANRLKDDFLATLSHELRTPLNAILGYSRMLRSGVVDRDRQARALEIVERNATALSQMVADVLDVSRIVAGKVHLNVQLIDLTNVVEEAIATIRPAAEAKGVRLQTVMDTGAGPVLGDADRLQQVIWNLLSNAVRFTPRGGLVRVRLQRIDSHLEIVVSDTGAGIAPEFLPHVFERFRQADSRLSREYGGLGLGLAISRELIELHGGTVRAESDGLGKGATFSVSLPRSIPSLETPFDATNERRHGEPYEWAATTGVELKGLQILIVDNDPDALTLMRDILEAAGATVTSAESGPAALRALDERIPHAMVSDLGMPGMDGFELLARVRQSPVESRRNIPAASLTAYARSEDRTRSLKSGFQIHLSKPIDPRELVAAVAALVSRVDTTSS